MMAILLHETEAMTLVSGRAHRIVLVLEIVMMKVNFSSVSADASISRLELAK